MLLSFSIAEAQDSIPPEKPVIKYVTVDTATNNVIIYWINSPSPDTEKYRLYYETTLGGVLFDSVSANQNFFIHSGAPASSVSWIYSIAAVDSSGNASPRAPGFHRTVHTSTVYDSCANRMKVSWNKYVGWGENVSGYRIYGSENNATFILLNGVTASDSFYYHYGVNENHYYEYFVEAVKNDGLVSSSNIALKYTYMPAPPESLIAEYATVTEKNVVKLSFSVINTSSVNNYALLRSGDKSADFIMYKTLNHSGSGNITFMDSIITSREKFYYKLSAINSCNKVMSESVSNLAVNILLKGNSAGNSVDLEWNPYEEFPEGVSEYVIYTKTEGGVLQERDRVGGGIIHYNDKLADLRWQSHQGELSYLVMAVEYNTGVTAFSNEFSVMEESELFVPNAFTPNDDGVNDIFLPVFSFIPEEYIMIIYDRYGIRIFSTKNPETGWDGTLGGSKANEGVYMYYIEYKSFNGKRRNLTGNVTLFYPF